MATVQIILNAFRRKPLEQVLPAAARGGCRRSSPGCRWPAGCSPASTTSDTTFAADDHRTYNRHGEAFDVGETFSGVPFEVGVAAARRARRARAGRRPTAQFALRWVMDQPGVTVVIPGARNAEQARGNAAAAELAAAAAPQLAERRARSTTELIRAAGARPLVTRGARPPEDGPARPPRAGDRPLDEDGLAPGRGPARQLAAAGPGRHLAGTRRAGHFRGLSRTGPARQGPPRAAAPRPWAPGSPTTPP